MALPWFTAFIVACTSFYSMLVHDPSHPFFGLKLFMDVGCETSFTAYINLLWHLVADKSNHRKDLTGGGCGGMGGCRDKKDTDRLCQ